MTDKKQENKKKDTENVRVYSKGKEEIYTKSIHTATGEKIKTIKKTTYPNGVVKERVIHLDKTLPGGGKKRIY